MQDATKAQADSYSVDHGRWPAGALHQGQQNQAQGRKFSEIGVTTNQALQILIATSA
ncbi:MAG: hypothetical protein U0931_29455 [Vulcanimicrobiota bacterium]